MRFTGFDRHTTQSFVFAGVPSRSWSAASAGFGVVEALDEGAVDAELIKFDAGGTAGCSRKENPERRGEAAFCPGREARITLRGGLGTAVRLKVIKYSGYACIQSETVNKRRRPSMSIDSEW